MGVEEMRLGPIEWGVVTAHNPWGLGVRLEEEQHRHHQPTYTPLGE